MSLKEMLNLTVKPELVTVFKENYLPQDTVQVIERIKGTYPREYDFFNKAPLELICLDNGILNLKTLELTPHTPELGFLGKLPIKYDPQAKCPEIQKAIQDWVKEEDPQRTEEKEKTLYEFIGYCLLREYPFHKALFIEGEAGNGKTTFYNLMTRFLGIENCARISLERIGDRFKTVELYGRLINLSDELSVKTITDIEKFKQLTGESPIEGEQKFIQHPIRFKNYAKIVCAANKLPPIENADKAFYARAIIMKFLNYFPPDDEFIKRITAPEELSGLLNLALEGLKRLCEQKEFTLKIPIMELEREWTIDLVQEFVQEKITVSPDSEVSFPDLYGAFVELCESKMERPCSQETFGIRLSNRLRKMNVQFTKTKVQKKGQRLWVYRGIRLSSETDESNGIIWQGRQENLTPTGQDPK
jgi:putative DNA primase/helicase